MAFKEGGIRQTMQLFVCYANNILGGCGFRIEFFYKSHHLLSRIVYKFYNRKLVDYCDVPNKFLHQEYIVLNPDFSKVFLDNVLEKCKLEMHNKKNISKIADKNNKPFNGLLSTNVPAEYYSKQVKWLCRPSFSVPDIVNLCSNHSIDKVLRSLFKSNYTIENIAMYKTLNIEEKETYNLNSRFHTDNNPSTSLKMMIYLCDVDNNNGPFLVREKHNENVISITGRAGTTVIFKSHTLYHAAKNTCTGSRYAVFFTLVPSLRPQNNNVTCDAWLNIPYRINPFLPLGN